MLAAQVAAVVATGSRAAVLGFLAMAGWMAWTGCAGRRRYAAAMLLLAALIVPAVAPSRPLSTTLAGRLYVWRVAVEQMRDTPFFGHGPGAFARKYAEWQMAQLPREAGNSAEAQFAAFHDHAHNDYLEILVDYGPAGLAALIGLFLYLLVAARRCTVRQGSEAAGAAGMGLSALLAVALVDFPFHRPAELFVFWTLAAVIALEIQPHDHAGQVPS